MKELAFDNLYCINGGAYENETKIGYYIGNAIGEVCQFVVDTASTVWNWIASLF